MAFSQHLLGGTEKTTKYHNVVRLCAEILTRDLKSRKQECQPLNREVQPNCKRSVKKLSWLILWCSPSNCLKDLR